MAEKRCKYINYSSREREIWGKGFTRMGVWVCILIAAMEKGDQT